MTGYNSKIRINHDECVMETCRTVVQMVVTVK